MSCADPDPDQLREQSRCAWGSAAAGWERRQETMRLATAAVSHWMVEAIGPQPGHRVLELAAGVGETGFLAAELIRPGGGLICSDQSEEMLAAARARAGELALANVEFRVLDAEWIDLELASVDAVLCRWGYMLMPDPGAALRETRRVLRPGGRVALAVWEEPEANPWASVPARALVAQGLAPPPAPGAPGMFALGRPATLEAVLEQAGFTEVEIETLDFEFRYPSPEAWWETQRDISPALGPALASLPEAAADALRASILGALAEHWRPSGEAVLPARTLVASAGA